MNRHCIGPAILLALPWASAAAQDAKTPAAAATPAVATTSATAARICLAPASVEAATGNANDAVNAVREAFTTYLTGPTIGVTPLTARLQSQAREEAKAANCAFILLPTVKQAHKSGGGSIFGKAVSSAAQQAAYSAGDITSSTAGRVAAGAAAGAASGAAASTYAGSTRAKDELTLTSRLESASGKVLVDQTDKRKAQSDGEDLLTPMVEKAATAVAAAVTNPAK